jgi:hypothetical protein
MDPRDERAGRGWGSGGDPDPAHDGVEVPGGRVLVRPGERLASLGEHDVRIAHLEEGTERAVVPLEGFHLGAEGDGRLELVEVGVASHRVGREDALEDRVPGASEGFVVELQCLPDLELTMADEREEPRRERALGPPPEVLVEVHRLAERRVGLCGPSRRQRRKADVVQDLRLLPPPIEPEEDVERLPEERERAVVIASIGEDPPGEGQERTEIVAVAEAPEERLTLEEERLRHVVSLAGCMQHGSLVEGMGALVYERRIIGISGRERFAFLERPLCRVLVPGQDLHAATEPEEPTRESDEGATRRSSFAKRRA